MVAVVGGVGPFAGSVGFVVRRTRVQVPQHGPSNAVWSRHLNGGQHHGRSRHARDGRLGVRGHRPGVAQAGGRRRSPRTRPSSRSRPTRSTPRSPPRPPAPWSRSTPPRATPCPSAPCSPRSRRQRRRRPPHAAPEEPPAAEASAAGEAVDDRHARDGRVGLRGHDPRVGQAARRRRRRPTRRSSRSRPTRSTPRCPRPRPARWPRSSPRPATPSRRPGHRAHDVGGNGAAPAAAPAPEPDRRARARGGADTSRRPTASRSPRSPPASPPRTASTSRGPGQRPGRPHLQGRRARPPTANGAAPRRRAAAEDATLHQGRRGDARALHGRVALDPDRDLVPHPHRHDARRAPQAAQGRRPEGLLHAPDRLRDRARRHRADAGDGAPLRRDRRQAAPRRRRRRSTSASPSTSSARTAGAR